MVGLDICMHLSMLTGQTDLSPNQPINQKVENLHNLVIFQLIWLELGMESLNGRTQHMLTIYPVKPAKIRVQFLHRMLRSMVGRGRPGGIVCFFKVPRFFKQVQYLPSKPGYNWRIDFCYFNFISQTSFFA